MTSSHASSNTKRRPINEAAYLAEQRGMKSLAVVWASPFLHTNKYLLSSILYHVYLMATIAFCLFFELEKTPHCRALSGLGKMGVFYFSWKRSPKLALAFPNQGLDSNSRHRQLI
jgi:hypothetical protein